jgi:flavin-binding protein dodecin
VAYAACGRQLIKGDRRAGYFLQLRTLFAKQRLHQRAWFKPNGGGNVQKFQHVKAPVPALVFRHVRRRLAQLLRLSARIDPMAKKQSDTVYRIVDVVGISEKSWEDAGRRAVETAAGSIRDLRVAEVTKMDMKVEDGKVTAFRTRVALSFKYEA